MLTLHHLAADRQAERERRIREQAPAPANVQLALAHPARETDDRRQAERVRPRLAPGLGG